MQVVVAVTPTMPAEQPRIVKRQDGRHLPVEPLQRSQVEIAAVEVVAVNHVRSGRREIEEVVRSRELEVFPSADLFHEGAWMRGKSERSAQPSPARAGRPARHPVESLLKRRIPGHAVDGPAIIREREDIRVVVHPSSHGHRGLVAAAPVRLHETVGDRRGAASRVDGPNLQYPQRPVGHRTIR
jgi:hypothetical protein